MSSAAELQSKALTLIVRSRTLMAPGVLPGLDSRAELERADQVASLCAEALYAAGGFGAVSVEAAFASEAALEVLKEEFELSPAMVDPLRLVRARVMALSAGGGAHPLDTFVAFQATAIASALIEWTDDLLSRAFPGESSSFPQASCSFV